MILLAVLVNIEQSKLLREELDEKLVWEHLKIFGNFIAAFVGVRFR